jgi:hypothetical protein
MRKRATARERLIGRKMVVLDCPYVGTVTVIKRSRSKKHPTMWWVYAQSQPAKCDYEKQHGIPREKLCESYLGHVGTPCAFCDYLDPEGLR